MSTSTSNLFNVVFGLAFLALIIILLVFWVRMLIAMFQNDQLETSSKVAWAIGILGLGWIGALIYYYAVHKKKAQPKTTNKKPSTTKKKSNKK